MFAELKSQKTFFCNTAILHLFFPSYFKVGKIIMFHHHFCINFKLKNFSLKSWCIFALKELSINLHPSFKSLKFLIPFFSNFNIFRLNFNFDDIYFLQIIAFMKGNSIDKITQVLQRNRRIHNTISYWFHYFSTFHVIWLAL